MRRRTLTPRTHSDATISYQSRSGFMTLIEADIFARTIWGEARTQGARGMHAVANVIINRLRLTREEDMSWWGVDLVSICQKPYQFACWNPDHADRSVLMAVDGNNAGFAQAMKIARCALAGELPDITGGATHYHPLSEQPYWAENKLSSAQIGHSIFYRITG